MLATVIMFFLVLSFTGVAVLDLSYNSRELSNETVHNIKLQYATESAINEALWLLNSGNDSLVNIDSDNINRIWDSETHTLTVGVEMFDTEYEVQLDLSEDTHFQRGLAASSNITTYGYSTGLEDKHRMRQFDFMPVADLKYFADHATWFHHGNQASWSGEAMTGEGVHIFTGNNLVIDGISLNNSTLVFTGKDITFTGTITIRAPFPVDSMSTLPALVFTNPDNEFTLGAGNHIEGAIYCAGQLNLHNPTITGPVVSQTISLNDDLNILDSEYEAYYRWTLGFGSQDDYDWPKQIHRWKSSKLLKNNLG